jgi:hypothetical protein
MPLSLPRLLTRSALALPIALLVGALAGPPAHAAPTAGVHPRIFLDAHALTALRARARAGDPAWRALKARCDEYRADAVEWPDGNDYPDGGGIGEGYQGDGYYPALLALGLCHQVALGLDGAAAARYGAIGAAVLQHMSAPPGDPHYQDPIRDDGYGVRFFAGGMALGYDWLYDALSPTLRARVTTSGTHWLSVYEHDGFEHDFPQGNYFAGYYSAKAYAGLAFARDSAAGDATLADWRSRVQGRMVQPYYAANLSGGGWPEGWNYGPLGATNMSLPALAARTALGVDLVHDAAHPFAYPLANPRYLLYFTWPDLKNLDDAGKLYDSEEPSATEPWFFTIEAGLLRAFGDPFAATFTRFASAVRAAQPGTGSLGREWDLVVDLLFGDPKAPQTTYKKLPLSYDAAGMEKAAMRSDWSTKAVWGAFTSGPYTGYDGAGEEYFDEGSLAVVNGRRPLLVNATGALMRDSPGTQDGAKYETPIGDDLFFGKTTPRDLFNVFVPAPGGQSTRLRSDGARTRISAFHDGGAYVVATGSHLEDMYARSVKAWTRTVAYVRPGLFVVHDRTRVADAKLDQHLAFHVPGEPTVVRGGRGGARRYDVGGTKAYAGTIDTVLPAGHRDTRASVLGGRKVVRIEVRPGRRAASQEWLTVVDAASSARKAAAASPLKVSGGAVGVVLRRGTKATVVVFAHGSPKRLRYALPHGKTRQVVTGLRAGAAYRIRRAHGRVTITPGTGAKADTSGSLTVTTG